MDGLDTRALDAAKAKIARRHVLRMFAGALLGTFALASTASGLAKRKGGRKKKVCKCAIGFHCEKGKCVPDA